MVPRLGAMKNGGMENVRAYTGGAANIPRQPKSCWIYSRGLNYGRDMYGTRVGPEMWAMK